MYLRNMQITPGTGLVHAERPSSVNKSKYYLQKQKEREREIDRLLELTINKGKNEYEYEMLIKMGEANELSQLLTSKITYRAYKGAVRYTYLYFTYAHIFQILNK